MELIIIIIIFIGFSTLAIAGKSFAPWVPTKKKDVGRVIKLAKIKPGEFWFELGCGDGRMSKAAAQAGAKATGIELALPLYLAALIRTRRTGTTIKFGSLFKTDLTKADVVYFFGMPDKIASKLKIKLEAELMPGTRVISYAFPVEGWEPLVVDKPTEDDIEIYLYRR